MSIKKLSYGTNRRSFLKTSAAGLDAFETGIHLIIPEDAQAADKI